MFVCFLDCTGCLVVVVCLVFFFSGIAGTEAGDSAPGGSGQRLFRQPNSVQKNLRFLTRALQPENDQFSLILLFRSIIYQYLCYGRLGCRSEVRYFEYNIRELTSNYTGFYVQKYPVVSSIPGIVFCLLSQVMLWRYVYFHDNFICIVSLLLSYLIWNFKINNNDLHYFICSIKSKSQKQMLNVLSIFFCMFSSFEPL